MLRLAEWHLERPRGASVLAPRDRPTGGHRRSSLGRQQLLRALEERPVELPEHRLNVLVHPERLPHLHLVDADRRGRDEQIDARRGVELREGLGGPPLLLDAVVDGAVREPGLHLGALGGLVVHPPHRCRVCHEHLIRQLPSDGGRVRAEGALEGLTDAHPPALVRDPHVALDVSQGGHVVGDETGERDALDHGSETGLRRQVALPIVLQELGER